VIDIPITFSASLENTSVHWTVERES